MKITCRWLAMLMTLAMLLTVPAYAESIPDLPLDMVNARMAYDDMKRHYENFEYNEARQLIMDNPGMLEGDGIQDAKLYKLFLDGLFYMDNGDFFNAQLHFGNAIQNDTENILHNPQNLYNYCLGRYYEESGRYEDAIQKYGSTLYGDHIERAQACDSLLKAAKLTQANQYLTLGKSMSNIDMLQQALTLYQELGNSASAALCQAAIEEAQKKAAYDAAVALYNDALLTGNVQALQNAVIAFIDLGSYSDSAARAQAIMDHLMLLTRELTLTTVQQEPASIVLTWSDTSAEACAYTVTWKPQHAPEACLMTTAVSERQVSLTELFPNTVYEISICPADLPELLLTTQVKTAAAPVHADRQAAIRSFEVYGYARHRMKEDYRPRDCFMKYQSNLAIDYKSPEGRMILEPTSAFMQPYVYVYRIYHGWADRFDTPAMYQWLLRTQHAGVYAAPAYEDQSVSRNFFCDDLEALLDQLYAALGQWPGETCQLELYVDGAYVLAVPLIISGK